MKNSKGDTEVIFADGRHEIVVAEKNPWFWYFLLNFEVSKRIKH